jgi:SpoVK/Ycf46/Vps4 family AAA+-type ATPase
MYMVGFSELSTTPEGLERNLRSILSLATAWDAVLLIDEADVFLEQRSLEQIERNALVSVALRLLEYHRGVLFLTTNRIGTFDEAFLSRFSIAIKYDELDHDGRLVVWKRFLELAQSGVTDSLITHGPETDLTAEVLSDLAHKPFNGRTIKNLVRTAQALAMSQREQLSLKHIKTVVRVQEKFFQEFGSTNDKYN